ncbi:MAG: MlaD family protein [Spirochaetales bacterium]|jgi:phospholipid/cholesterol/gamma-HCH transport system substrate-binding protein|nr:MlaD family protein [Spirochaetales bacterium]
MSRLFKIGVFVIITSIATIWYMMHTASRIEGGSTYLVEAYMEDASGLLANTAIRMAGVNVGKVQSIELSRGRAKLMLEIASHVELYEDARIEKKLDSMMGSSSIAIYPGIREENPLRAGGIIQNTLSADAMSKALGNLGVTAEEATGLIKDLRKFLNEDGGFLAVQDILESTRSLTQTANALVERNLILLAAALQDIGAITTQMRGTNPEDMAPIAAILRNTAAITQRLDRILAQNDENINASMGDLRESIAKLNIALDNVAQITAKINQGEGTIGKLITDDSLYNQVEGFLGSSVGLDIQIAFQSDYLFKQEDFRNQFGARLTPGSRKDKFYYLGLVDSPRLTEKTITTYTTVTGTNPPASPPFGTNYTTTELESQQKLLINAQIAQKFGMFTLRGGVVESTGGVGLDFQPIKQIALGAEIFDFAQEKGPFLRLYGTLYPFFDPNIVNPLNWIYLAGGVDNVLTKKREGFVSMGLRFTDNDIKGIATIGGGLTGMAK